MLIVIASTKYFCILQQHEQRRIIRNVKMHFSMEKKKQFEYKIESGDEIF